MCLFATSLLLLGSYATAQQDTWYVDINASSSGTGTQADPFRSIQAALSNPLVSSSDTILVAPGTYVEDIEFRGAVALESIEGPEVTIIAAASSNSITVSFRSGLNESRLEGFTIQGNRQSGGSSTGLFVPDLQDARIFDCIVRGHQRAAFNEFDMALFRCTITDNEVGLELSALSISFVLDSILWDNGTTFTSATASLPFINTNGSLVDVDPLFFRPGSDFHLRRTSPAIDLGEQQTLDLDGSPPDAGAYPFDPSYPVGQSECRAAANSTSLPGRLFSIGSASLMRNDLVLVADQLPASQTTLLIVGDERAETPLGNGTLCIGGQIARLSLRVTNATGEAVFPLDKANSQLTGLAIPGNTLHFQAWHRDSAGPSFFNLTNSVQVTLAP